MKSKDLIQQMIDDTCLLLNKVRKLNNYEISTLTWKNNPNSWSILECLEHLNLYGDFYLPEIEKAIKNSTTSADENFSSGFLGGYFDKSMLPKQKLNKMSKFMDKNPLHADLDKRTIDRFIIQQEHLIQLLSTAQKVSLNRIKITTTLSRFIRLKLGVMLPFLVNHNIRHFQQIERIEEVHNNS